MSRQRWLITGGMGQLGGYLLRELSRTAPNAEVLAISRTMPVTSPPCSCRRLDLSDFDVLRGCLAEFRPTYVIHAAAMSAVGECHNHPADAERINAAATRVLGEAAAECGARLLYTSTDMVFAGDRAPYRETDEPAPLSCYGRTKVAGERALTDLPRALTVRLPLLYGVPVVPRETTFVRQIAALRAGDPLRLFTDEYRTPAWCGDAARALVGLAVSDLSGLIHVAGPERLSRYEMVDRFARLLGIAAPKLEPASRLSIDAPEPRPADLSLDCGMLAREFPGLVPGPIRGEVFVS